MLHGNSMKIDARISVIGSYDDEITISVYDKSSGSNFLELKLTREQFINAVLNRLSHTPVKEAIARLDYVGKKQEIESFEFELPDGCRYGDAESAQSIIKNVCPDGWKPDLSFSSQDSFSIRGDKLYAKTSIRRWV